MSVSATHSPRCLVTRALFLLIPLLTSAIAYSQSATGALYDEVRTIADPAVAVPIEHSFDLSNSGTYQVTLIDQGQQQAVPAPLSSVKLAISSGDTLVGAPLTAAGSLQLTATPGTYMIHVVGTPGPVPGSGPIGIQVTEVASGTQLYGFSDTLGIPQKAVPQSTAVLDDTFTVGSSGNYQVGLTDLQFPQSLGTLTLLLIAEGTAAPVVTLPDSANGNAMQAVVSLATGVNYRVFAIGKTGASSTAGLFTTTVSFVQDGKRVYSKAVPVGATTAVGGATLAAGSTTLTLTDLGYPAALSSAIAVLVNNGQTVAQLSAPGSQTFTAVAGPHTLFAFGLPSTGGSAAGSYAVQLVPAGGGAALSLARGVTASGSTLSAYSFDTTVPADTYKLSLTDFELPAALSTLNLVAAQAGAVLGTPLSAAGSADITASSGPLSLVAFAQASASGGLFGIDVVSTAASTSVFSQTQGVGALFRTQKVSVTSAGRYAAIATDLGFPAMFANYDVVLTQGAQRIGSIYGNGTFWFDATPGNYYLNFIAQPTGTDEAGTYALKVVPAPAPAVTLTSDAGSVASGKTVRLTWTSQNATACTASGGWTGTQSLNDSASTPAITAATTFTLTCTGLGGSTAQSVTVNVDAPASGGGGGSLGPPVILLLLASLLVRAVRMSPKVRLQLRWNRSV